MIDPFAARSLIDISIVVREDTPEWPGDTPFSCHWTWDMQSGASVNVSCINGSPHVGTHADAPFHVNGTWPTSESMPLEAFIGPATVIDVSHRVGPLEREELSIDTIAGGRLLLRTSRTIADDRFPDAWPWLTPACVARLASEGLRLVGVDAPSVDARDSTALDTHRAIFSAGAVVLENLDLRSVHPGNYELISAPLRVAGLDAAPVRAALRPLPHL